MKVFDWNVGPVGSDEVIRAIERHVGEGEWVAMLQEVEPKKMELLRQSFSGDDVSVAYSLDHRPPGPYDGRNRKKGVAVLAGGGATVCDADVLWRSPFPDRTLWARVAGSFGALSVLSLHSLTGCGYKKAKSAQFRAFAEQVERMRPYIVAFDANEPDVDHYDIGRMVFFNNEGGSKIDDAKKGLGARTFFEKLAETGLVDALVASGYDESSFVPGEPLALSHLIKKGGKKKRYDFTMVNRNAFDVKTCEYCYDEAVDLGGDHAFIVTELAPRQIS